MNCGAGPVLERLVGGQVRLNGLRLFAALHDQIVAHLVGLPENPAQVFENHELRFVYRPAFIAVGPPGSKANGLILRW